MTTPYQLLQRECDRLAASLLVSQTMAKAAAVKRCRRCGAEKELSEFRQHKGQRRHSWCRMCEREASSLRQRGILTSPTTGIHMAGTDKRAEYGHSPMSLAADGSAYLC